MSRRRACFTDEESLQVPPLTNPERRWIHDLQSVLARCPARLELVTIGDAVLEVIDRDHAGGDLHDGAASRRGIVLAMVEGTCRVHGVSG